MSHPRDVKDATPGRPQGASFVYPTRTLLAANIHNSHGSEHGRSASSSGQTSAHGEGSMAASSVGDTEVPADHHEAQEAHLVAESSTPSPRTKHSARRRMHRSPNFRDFSPEEDPLLPRSFSTPPLIPITPTDAQEPRFIYTAGPAGEPVQYTPHDLQDFDESIGYRNKYSTQVSEVAAEAFADYTEAAGLIPGFDISVTATPPSNFSQSGYVHLPPAGPPSSRSHSVGSRSRGRTRRGSVDLSASGLSEGLMEQETEGAQLHATRPHSAASGSGSASGSASASGQSTGSSDGPHIAFRCTNVEDEDGHHVIVGREGELTKCEDEPIRTPGAVQGFGVLIAIEEDYETGNLVVQQVSENSTELLGLSPKFLFSLECFTQTLSDSQADLLLDNIQYLSDSALSPEEQAENVHVFLLSGFGQPGSALPEELTADPHKRRTWECWVAAHRPQMTTSTDFDPNSSTASNDEQNGEQNGEQSAIILEFELERDHFNPLYPPLSYESIRTGVSSPSEGSDSASTDITSSSSSGRTLVSSGSGSQIFTSSTPDGSNPSANSSNPSLNSITAATSPTPEREQEETSSLQEASSSADEWMPSREAILESTTSRSKPLLALERLRRTRRGVGSPGSPASSSSSDDRGSPSSRRGGVAVRRRRGIGAVGMMDVFSVMSQINEQLGAADDLDSFMKVVVGVIKDLTQFHRVLVYQFDEAWNGKVLAELVDWTKTHDLYKGLHFPATDIPAQARALYALNKVRILYDRGLPTARLVARGRRDLETPLDMSHCYLRAMSPIHLKYLGNMGVRASMSVSIIAFNQLWGLVACHSYGPHGMRVSFPVRQMLRLLSQSISRNVERLCYAQRLHTRKLINTLPNDQHPSGYIVSDADDLLGLFDADYGVLVIGEGAKILGPHQHGQEILVIAEYLRLKQFNTTQVSQAITEDYPDLQLSSGLEVIAGLLYIPLSVGGGDFIAFLRKGQPRQVHWAGRPYKPGEPKNTLEPRTSFKIWSETVAGRSRAWSDEHLETAGVLALVYGKFIEVWRQKESALQTTKLTNILLSNASHEVRTPLNHIINYLELALNGQLDFETRENLSQSHAASKSLLFTINDLLDLTRLESGHETSFNEPFDLCGIVYESTMVYRNEASRRGLQFDIDISRCPRVVVGDAKKIRTVIANLTANALKYTTRGRIAVECQAFEDSAGLADLDSVAVEIVVSDTGCGMLPEKLESIFREFEQVETSPAIPTPPLPQVKGLGLGLAVVARIVEQLGGQLRVDSKVNEGSRFSFLVAFSTGTESNSPSSQPTRTQSRARDEIDSLVSALSTNPLSLSPRQSSSQTLHSECPSAKPGSLEVPEAPALTRKPSRSKFRTVPTSEVVMPSKLRVLIVEDNDINRTILSKRLSLDGHDVVNTTNGQEGLDMVESDREFDAILMDIQMPLLNGYEATERIRALELESKTICDRLSQRLNGRIPIFAVSASLREAQREEMCNLGIDGWILKPIDFKRLRVILRGVTDTTQRAKDVYYQGCSWEYGGWLALPQLLGSRE